MKPGDDMKFTYTRAGAPGFLQDIIYAHLVRARFALAAAECAEFAAIHADIRRVDVHVLHEINLVPVLLFADMGRHAAECEQVAGFEEFNSVFARQAFPEQDFFLNSVDGHEE